MNLLQDIPDSWPILVVSTWETRAEDGGASACGAFGAAVDFGGGHNGGDMGGVHRAQRRRSLAGSLPPGDFRRNVPWFFPSFGFECCTAL